MKNPNDIVEFYRAWLVREQWPETVGESKEQVKNGDPLFNQYRTLVRNLISLAGEDREKLEQVGSSLLLMGVTLVQLSKTTGTSLDVLKEEITSVHPDEDDDRRFSDLEIFLVDPPEDDV